MLSFTFQLFHSSFLFLFSRFVSSSFVGIAIVELWWRKRERERDEEKGKEKEGKETRQKVGTIQLVVRVSQPLNWITVAVTAGRELLFNSLKLYAWCFRYLSRQPLLSAITPCTLSLAESLDYYTFIPAPAVSLSSSSIPSNTTPPPSLSFSPPLLSTFYTHLYFFFPYYSPFSHLSIFCPPSLSLILGHLFTLQTFLVLTRAISFCALALAKVRIIVYRFSGFDGVHRVDPSLSYEPS